MFASVASAYLLLPLLLASYVSAHGFVHQFSVNGKTYTGARPGGQRNKAASPIRQITSPNPIYGATNTAVNCGNGGGFVASEAAPVNPGDTLKFDWRGQDLSRVRSFASLFPRSLSTNLLLCSGPTIPAQSSATSRTVALPAATSSTQKTLAGSRSTSRATNPTAQNGFKRTSVRIRRSALCDIR